MPDLAGSLGGGGRYDGLIGMFRGEAIPACGFSLGLERILVVMGERGCSRPDVRRGAADVLVTLFEGEPIEEALRLAAELRGGGLRVEVYPEPDKLGKQFKYASARGIRFVTVVGGDERARGRSRSRTWRPASRTRGPREPSCATRLAARSDEPPTLG